MSRKGIVNCVLIAVITLSSSLAYAEEYPGFGEAYWKKEQDKAKGKMWRGAGLGVLGLAAVVPTVIFTKKATEDPTGFLAYSMVSGIAALGMTFHGFFSIAAGKKEKDKADYFVKQYQADPSSVDIDEERKHFMHMKKKTTGKLIFFGSVLTLQSAIFLTNGIVLSVKKHKGVDLGGTKIWPSYLLGGLLLPAGVTLIVLKSLYLNELNELESQNPAPANVVSIRPYFHFDSNMGSYNVGMMGQMFFLNLSGGGVLV